MYELDINVLNKLLNVAYNLGRENENRMERGMPELDVPEEFAKLLKELEEE